MIDFNNRTNRIKTIIELLSQGYSLSTPELVERFGVTKKLIQTDFKDYILPLYPNKTIFYDYSSKTYKAINNFLLNTLFNSEELAIISILKNKSQDKYSDENLYLKTNQLFLKFEDELSNQFYGKSSVEKIDKFKDEIIKIRNAIESKTVIKCFYNEKNREVYPLKILNLEEFWYLIVFEENDNKIKTFHLDTIKNIENLNINYNFDKEKVKLFDNAINAYYKPENKPIIVQLFIDSKVSRYFYRKPLNKSQRVIKNYDDKSCDIEVVITDLMEIIPTIQKYIPFIKVIEPKELREEIKNNIENYIKDNNY